MNIYALYRGDEFVDVGTAKELGERQGVKPDTIRWLAGCNRVRNSDEKRL